MAQKINMIGQKFGLLTVIDYAPSDKAGNAMWKCKCECGKEIITKGSRLRGGGAKSCGCQRAKKIVEYNQQQMKDISGQRFGFLIALEPTNKRNNNRDIIWKCQCDCGNICEVSGHSLRKGNTKSCGCQRTKSFGETKIEQLLKNSSITYIKEYSNDNCKYTDTQYFARFDFYLPNYNTLLEYDGRQHFISGTGNYDNNNKFKQTQEHDKFKNQWAKDNNITLIRIPWYQYDNLTIEDLLPETSQFIMS